MSIDTPAVRRDRRIAELYAGDPQVRDAEPSKEISAALRRPGLRSAEIIATVLDGYADRPALGQRAFEFTTDAAGRRTLRLLPRFETITYRELGERVGAVAAAWHHDVEHPVRAGDFVAMIGFTSSDYATLDLACAQLGAVAVPLQAGAARSQLKAIIAETAPRVLAATPELLDVAVDCLLAGSATEGLVVFDYHPDDDGHREAFESARTRLAEAGSSVAPESLDSVRARGSKVPPAPLFVPVADDDTLALLIYTSGSTGTPKGAMYTERLAADIWLATTAWFDSATVPAIGLNYLPMSHLAGRLTLSGILARGGTAYFAAKSDMSTLFEDLGLVRPTEVMFVPRVCDMVFQRYQSELDRRAAPDIADEQQVKAELRQDFLGGRVVSASVASAPLSVELKTFMESFMDVELRDGYGSTEAGGVLVDNQLCRPPVLDYKLVDVPELGYFRTDQPHPRGELLLKTRTIIPGYYKRPEVTAQIFDDDGYYKTGDIMAEIGPDQLVYVDRRNNVLKLSQGEFVAVSHLEAVYAASPLVGQIFVYGSSERAYVLAVVVPTAEAQNIEADRRKAAIAASLRRIAGNSGLNSYEIPRDFLIETEPFTIENGLLSGAGKLLRPNLKARYGARLEQLYTDMAEGQANELLSLRNTAAELPVLETIGRAAHTLLGCATTDLRPDAHFTELGGDSLSALSFSNLLQDIFEVEVPVGVVISPANGLRDLADYVERERNSNVHRPTPISVHGLDGSQVNAGDLTLDKFIDARTSSAAERLPAPDGVTGTVLLTGANGYLGRFLCLEWLERLDKSGGTLICVVRGSDAGAARKRLADAFDSGDPGLVEHFEDLAARRLEVLAGDIGEMDLGLDKATWNRLADNVDLIVHPAALVNHVLPYSQLFGPNVVGTAEVIRLAITTRLKPVTYLSTVGVAAQVDPALFDEDGDIRDFSPVRVIDDSYANGYGNSKWAGEVLLREANDLCGLPVTVFRSDMILAHSRYRGQLNVPDMFTRLLLSLVATGIAPFSFYRTHSDGTRSRAHYDGLPADFTAEAITTLGALGTAGFHTFDVVNPNDDGISLDNVVDWLIESGHPIQRIADYRDWFDRFGTALRALPEKQRQASVLPLLHAYIHPDRPLVGSAVPAEVFQTAVQRVRIGADNDIPHLSAQLIAKYATDLEHRALLG
ncbi:carboxylic acid reductase [Nocardia sp. KC 131]|uniref:carboxylic acid reductase n=1 Tax=Nocardia arseniciresistens TaxID=3392119 RepID=UPI00398F8278